MPSSVAAASLLSSRFGLERAGTICAVDKSPFVIGRARSCDLVLAGSAVSRRHAALVAPEGSLSVEDLGSRNGVWVNRRQVHGTAPLRRGDTLLLGDHPLQVVVLGESPAGAQPPRDPAPSSRDRAVATDKDRESLADITSPIDGTDQFVRAVDEALLTGRCHDAERFFSLHLARLLENSPRADDDPRSVETCALLALRLAEATRNHAWLDFVLRLYSLRGWPMAPPVAGAFCALAPKFGGLDDELRRAYVTALDAGSSRLGVTHRHSLDRTTKRASR